MNLHPATLFALLLCASVTLPACHMHHADEPAKEPLLSSGDASPKGVEAAVYKSATCGCCNKWVDHLRENGFHVTSHNVKDLTATRAKHGVPAKLSSCHTAIIGGYVVEGHVPADLIHRMLKEKPAIKGLAVPDMPVGSPGMEGLFSEDYDVLAFDAQGVTSVYAKR